MALGKLGGTLGRLDPERLLYMYVRKEAVLTSQIEGTQSTLSDLLRYENAGAPGTPVGDRAKVESLGRAAPSALKVYDYLRDRIIVSPTRVADALGLTWPTVQAAIERLEALGIAREVTGKRRDRIYAYERQLRVLDEGADADLQGQRGTGPMTPASQPYVYIMVSVSSGLPTGTSVASPELQ